jgi:cobalt-zinc-cadmium efflux system outer membrane protein
MRKNTHFTRLLIALIALLACSAPLRAQATSSPPTNPFLDPQTGLTETELVARALANNPALAAERQGIDSAKGSVAQARLRANPSLAVGGLTEVNGDDNRFSIGTEIPLELFGRRARRTEVAEQKLNSTRATVTDKERLLAGEVRLRFAETLAAARNVDFVEQLLRANQEFLKLMEDRVREGAIPSLDAEEVRVETNRIESLRIDYQAKAEISVLALKEAVGMQPEENLRLMGNLEQPALSLDKTQLLQLATDHRPDLTVQRANEAMATAAVRQQETEAKTDATFSASYERPNSGFALSAFDAAGNLQAIRQTFNYAVFGMRWTLPLFNRNQGAIAAAKAEVTAARNQVTASDLALRHEVTQNLVRYQASQERVTVYRKGVRDQAARNLEVVRQTYGYGRIPLLDVIAEQRRFIDIETGYTDVLFDAYASRVALERAVGTSLP